MGRPADLIRFREGDLVNIVYDDTLSAGIVVSPPPTDKEVMQRFEKFQKEFTAVSDREVYNAFNSESSADCYRIMVAHRDNSMSLESVPSSRVIKLQLEHHLPYELASLLNCKLRENTNK